ncbi:hypothetical protein [Roseiarcus sp.]|uniref:hypothetical protein n=1 Tax=Roseiarcus sp. TaxID=1969460 RepID=UPI003F9DAF02
MNVFDLDRAMIDEYAAFSRSFTKIRAQDIRDQIDAAYASRKYWPEPILQINPHYKRDKSVSDLVRERVLHPSCNVVFADWELRTHQVQSVHIARERRSFVVTTGRDEGDGYEVSIEEAVLNADRYDR